MTTNQSPADRPAAARLSRAIPTDWARCGWIALHWVIATGAAGSLDALAAPPATTARDRQAELWAAGCVACHHGAAAAGTGSRVFSGRNTAELLETLLRQRAGQADTTLMHQITRGFSESELARIAAILSAQPSQ